MGNVRFDFCQQLTQSAGADCQIALQKESILFVTESSADFVFCGINAKEVGCFH
jgi:hypothetical protein